MAVSQPHNLLSSSFSMSSSGLAVADLELLRHKVLLTSSLYFLQILHIKCTKNHISKLVTEANPCWSKERIKKMFDKIELSVSSYDTAWVAMVPSPDSPQDPCFPGCIHWLMENQLHNGSWGLPNCPSWLLKDTLSCTLACVLALKRWGIGEEQMHKGVQFIESNFASVNDEKQHTPIGFDVIFPGMIEYAKDLNLNLPLRSTDVEAMLRQRQYELRRSYQEGRKEYLAYVSEGMQKLQDWEMVMKYQRKNGSVFNSPSTTAAALLHLQNTGCLHYLRSLIEKFKNSAPTVYPLHKYVHLTMVDVLERLGIDRHFKKEIRRVLDETYLCWLHNEDEIFLDTATCAMAFRILRANGYDVSSGPLTQLAEENQFFNSLEGNLKDINVVLELYRASELIIYTDDLVLEKQKLWTSQFLKEESSKGPIHSGRPSKYVSRQVEDALKLPDHVILDRIMHKRYIKHYDVDNIRMLKTSYRSLNLGNEDYHEMAVEDFHICQSLHSDEFEYFKRWIVKERLDKLNIPWQKLVYCYFTGAATLFSPEISDARMSWVKGCALATVTDQFFDVTGSDEEVINLVQVFEKWIVNEHINCCSEQVEIVFSAIVSTINELGEKASLQQGRNVTSHIVEIWLDLLKSMQREALWWRYKTIPTMDEYLRNGYVSFGLGPIVLPSLYFVGPKLSEEVVTSPEYRNLFTLMSACGRLLNDTRSYKREHEEEGIMNAISLQMIDSSGIVSEEEAVEKINSLNEITRRELWRLVLQQKGSVVPRACKDVFWKMCKVVHMIYVKDDGFVLLDIVNSFKEVVYEPVFVDSF